MAESHKPRGAEPKVRNRIGSAATIAALAMMLGATARGAEGAVERVATLRVPGEALASFDIGIVTDQGLYALADRSNKGVDLIEAASGRFVGRVTGFKGFDKAAGAAVSGPDGVLAVGTHEIWAGDGDSSVKVIDIASRSIVATIATGGQKRVDEMAYDPDDQLVIVVNNADKPPFVTFISARTRKIVGKLVLDHATDGAEQPVWDPVTRKVYLTIPVLDGADANGAVAVIDAAQHKLERMIPVAKCMPSGLTAGPAGELLIACSDDAIDAGFPAQSLIMDGRSGKIVATIDKVGGSDEVWYDSKSGYYYLAAAKNPGGPVLGVIDARSHRWIANVPSGPRAHSVAADPRSGRVLVPIEARPDSKDCAAGCIAVYAPRATAAAR